MSYHHLYLLIPNSRFNPVFLSSYHQVYTTLRDITGTGEGNGPVIAFHDGFAGLGQWSGFLAGADRIAIDHHPYFAFTGGAITPVETFADSACDRFQVVNGR